MKKRKKILKSKKGIALESAILFMTAIASFCFILTSLTLIGRNRARLDSIYMDSYVESEQIGEHFVSYLGALPDPGDAQEDYSLYITEEFKNYLSLDENVKADNLFIGIESEAADGTAPYVLTVKNGDTDGRVILYIEARVNEGVAEVLSWRRSAPENTES